MHSKGLSNNPCREPNQPQFLILIPVSLRAILRLSSHLCPDLPKGLLPVGLHIKVLKKHLPSFILPT